LTADRWQLILRLYHRALGCEGEARVTFLDTACGTDDALRQQVESLLAEDPPHDFLAAPAIQAITGMARAELDALQEGRQIGAYRVTSRLGAGGMGEVYLARDTTLHRDVALKVLPHSFLLHPDRLARFKREAHILASLNHSNIAGIYGLEESEGIQALALELIDGQTLAERIARAPIPLDEALPIAKQIVDALEAAHEKGVIHRDLKPANIKVRPDGTVKVLDFGLAKLAPPDAISPTDVAAQPAMATEPSLILGTPAYMAPEQSRGKPVDVRADIWAFGCVLFEMLAGARAFRGDSPADTIAAIVSEEPNWQRLPADASVLRPLLARCLKKDPKQRLQAIGEARIRIEALLGGTSEEEPAAPTTAKNSSRRMASIAIAALAVGVLAGAMMIWAWVRPPSTSVALPSRFELVGPASQSLAIQGNDRDIAISPDGRTIVYRAGGSGALVVRALDQLDARPIAGIRNARSPFFSPDNRWIGFFDGATLKKVSVTGGTVVTIGQSPSPVPRGASWGDDNTIVFASQDVGRGLLRVSADGGEPTVLTTPDLAKGENDHWFPSMLPGGRGVLFTITTAQGADQRQIAVLDPRTRQQITLLRGSQAEYLPTGHLVYVAAGTLHAVRFDLEGLKVLGDPTPVVEATLTAGTGAGNYAISRQGTLVYVPDVARTRSLVWVDRTGQHTPLRAPPRRYVDLRLSPDARHVALGIRDQEQDIWIWDLERQALTRLTTGPGLDQLPVWTADGRHIVFGSVTEAGQANLFAQATSGTGTVERLTTSPNFQAPSFVVPDGTAVVGYDVAPTTGGDIVRFPLSRPVGRSVAGSRSASGTRTIEPLVRSPSAEIHPAMSPDMRYLAYESDESGLFEIYLRPFPMVNAGRWQVSTRGGTTPVWSRDGRELFYVDATNTLMAVPVQMSGTRVAWGEPVALFKAPPLVSFGAANRFYDVSPDGERFLMIRENDEEGQDGSPARLVVVLNWHEELKRLVPTN
jgi:eukaryotic-like serine/threonine-protein kinase